MVRANAIAREDQRRARALVHRLLRRLELRLADAQRRGRQLQPVEALGIIENRCVAARADIGKDDAHRAVDILRHLALGREQRDEARFEIRIGGVETNGQDTAP